MPYTNTPEHDHPIHHEDEPRTAILTFREQADGRKVSRLPGGKVVLVNLPYADMVGDGQRWRVRLRHRETYAVADPLERILPGPTEAADAAHAPGRAEKAAGTTSHRNGAHPLAAARADDPTTAALPELGDPANAAEVDPAGSADVPFAEMADPVTPPARVEPSEPPPDPASVVRPGDRIALFVDGANMDGACRAAGYFVDYGKARKFFQASGSCYAAFYYTADFSAQDPLQQRFLDYLSHAGFIIRRKPLKVIRDEETGERFVKINLDTEIVLDMLTTADNYDIAFLFSGDSDFERAVELLRSRGKRVYVVTSRRSLNRELAYVADKPIFLIEDYESVLHRDAR